jgi:hypothetical protein
MDKNSSIASLPWEEISAIGRERFDAVPKETLLFAVDVANHDQMFKSALESLQQTNPKRATFEEAEKLVEIMRESAKLVLETRK